MLTSTSTQPANRSLLSAAILTALAVLMLSDQPVATACGITTSCRRS